MYKIHYLWEMCRGKIHKMLKINSLRTFLRPFLGSRLGLFCVLAALLCVPACFLGACGSGEETPSCSDDGQFKAVQYSKLFRLGTACGKPAAQIMSIVGGDTLVKEIVFEKPVKRAVVLSSAQIGYMARLGAADRIVGVGEGKYVVDSSLYGKVAEVGNGPALSLEKVADLKPDMVMTFATGGGKDDYEHLQKLGLPLILTSEWQEQNPLAKAEWIKLFGMMLDEGDGAMVRRADSIFKAETVHYAKTYIRRAPPKKKKRPRVLAGMAYGGVWYAPGGKSFTATLIQDAGGLYLWAGDTTRELRLSLEEVLALADSADVWVNPGMFSKPDEILAAEPRVANIKAFREKRVCQNDGIKGPGDGNDFYEGAVARPAELLENMNRCLYQEIGADNGVNSPKPAYKWYRNIYNF
ncbi:iron complex transport system substrate-binding protein [Fibrobacter sp. UWP2]|nr:iron complex transport system substrate-binding protein [Fibrobacter sp. UWP2]